MNNPVLKLLHARFASRAISSEALYSDVINDILEAARMTPSCYNKQPWRFIVCHTPEGLQKGRECLVAQNRVWADRAPLLIFVYSKRKDDCILADGRGYHQFDDGMAVMSMLLSATYHGLIARPMAGYDPALAAETFGLEADDEVICAVALGKPSDDDSHVPDWFKGADKKPRERKPVSEIAKMM